MANFNNANAQTNPNDQPVLDRLFPVLRQVRQPNSGEAAELARRPVGDFFDAYLAIDARVTTNCSPTGSWLSWGSVSTKPWSGPSQTWWPPVFRQMSFAPGTTP